MFFKPITVTLDIDDLTVVQESIQDGSGYYRIAEQFLPVAKALVGGDDGGVFFITM